MNVLEYRAVQIWKIFPPFFILFGTFGNVLTITVLTQRRNRQTSTAIYLTALAVTDLLVLWTGLLRHWIIYMFEIDIRAHSAFGCKLHLFILYISFQCSSWFLVAVTTGRFIGVWFPHKVKTVCRTRNVCVIIVAILSFFLILNMHWFYGAGLKKNNSTQTFECNLLDNVDYVIFFEHYKWIDLCIFSLVPLTVLTSANVSIIVRLLTRKLKTRNQVEPTDHVIAERSNRISQLTITLLIVNTVFIICTPPISVYIIWEKDRNESAETNYDKAVLDLTWAIVNMLVYLNNTLNFFLYFLSGSMFRKQVKELLCRGRNCFGTNIAQATD
ncbi:cysteinyl leukotriene receptor 1-like [Mercenaria mercenaria]|uniref:cysteinyl leukotriene receptor 1-like n=1 Tax=Mercenaria mercenaria TaxID=6596 RepID=UPI00234F6195|nr:cysteinyl leukotriene receptor 1-like [Mercenaria mercenaria]